MLSTQIRKRVLSFFDLISLSPHSTPSRLPLLLLRDQLLRSLLLCLQPCCPSLPRDGIIKRRPSYDLADDDDTITPQPSEEEPSFLTKLTAYGLTTDSETSFTATIMLISMISFLILQLPKIINVDSVTKVIELVTLIITLAFFVANVVYQVFQPWIQNRRFDYVRQQFVKNKLLKLLSTNGKANVQLIRDLYKGLDKNHDSKVTSNELKTLLMGIQVQADGDLSEDLVQRVMDQLDLSGDDSIQEEEFVTIITKWIRDARKSLSKNDYNPLSFFTKPQVPVCR
ncbi:hypothetical protein L2E82_11336 [Cichorium intybus]|uniref:Uncharacterized protein n=1 Tax=Cichorium intybus TaxID=13427 RepID=A0ACB9GE56_CICIN|nr:hypothetical protein L2E82_11336 [Cichorium intybus]